MLLRYSFIQSKLVTHSNFKSDQYIQVHLDRHYLQESSDTDHSGNDTSEATDGVRVGSASELGRAR
jgi:hypothetical protein